MSKIGIESLAEGIFDIRIRRSNRNNLVSTDWMARRGVHGFVNDGFVVDGMTPITLTFFLVDDEKPSGSIGQFVFRRAFGAKIVVRRVRLRL